MPWQRTTGLLFKRLHKAARLFADEAHHGVPPIGSRDCISIKMIFMLSMSIREQKSDRGVRRNIFKTEPSRLSLARTVQMTASRQALMRIEAANMAAFIVSRVQHMRSSSFWAGLL